MAAMWAMEDLFMQKTFIRPLSSLFVLSLQVVADSFTAKNSPGW